jgi:ribosomal protein S21
MPIRIVVRPGEALGSALKRFRKEVERSRKLIRFDRRDRKRRTYYVKPSELRRHAEFKRRLRARQNGSP